MSDVLYKDIVYTHMLHNSDFVNNGLHIQWEFPNVIKELRKFLSPSDTLAAVIP